MKDLSVKSQLDLENNKILNGTTDTPTLPESIVNKEYVDNAVANVHPIFIGSGIFDLALGTDYSVTTFINTFYEDTTHTINNLKTDLDKIFAGCPVTISEIKNASSKVDNELSSPNVYLKVNSDYFLGYRDFKLTWIDPLDKGKLKYLYLTFPQQSSGNINYLVSDEYSLIPDSYEKNSDIIPTSTASSKKISDRLNNINIVGDVYKGQAYYDSTNNQLSISTYRRNAVVGIETDKSKPWFKVASFTSNKRAFLDSQISFHVSTGYGDRTKIIGILTAHFRTGTDYKWESGELTWSLCGDTIDLTHFVLAHNDQDPCIVELWCKCVYLYAGYHFDVIAENGRNATAERTWKLTQSWNKDGQTEITSGYTQIVSSYIQLRPNFNDRGFIKLKPNSDTDFSFNSSNLNLNSTEYLKVGTFRADTDAIAQSLTNCPTQNGFVMYVNDPLNQTIDNETTGTYVYRLREIRDWKGNIYYQAASSSTTAGTFTYSNWINITAGGSNINSKVDKSDLGLTTFKVTRTASTSSNGYGYWAAMLNSNQTGSPVLPSTNKWWHVLSMDWSGTTNNNTSWISQLALPTNDGGVPYYRRNNTSNTAIDSSTWHKFITDENIADQTVSKATSATSATKATQDSDGNTINTTYLKLSGGTMTGTINTALSGTHLNGNDGVNVVINSTATANTYQTLYRKKSTNGVFTLNGWNNNMLLAYTTDTVITARNNSVSNGIQFSEDGSLKPWVNNTQSLGTSDKKWSNVYATTFTGSLSGNASTATKLQTARKINTVSFDGSADITITANPTQTELTKEDLNTIKTPGEYFAGGGNTVTNKPTTSIDGFGLKVYKTGNIWLAQELTPSIAEDLIKYYRYWDNTSTWSAWKQEVAKEVSINTTTPTQNTVELWVDTSEEGIATSSILDSLTSTSTTSALSANQGKILNDKKLNLTGGTMTGDIGIPYYVSKTDGTVPYAGSQPGSQDVLTVLPTYKTYLGAIQDKSNSNWYNMVSIRHRNGAGDGTSYGMYLKAPLTAEGNLIWRQQIAKDVWKSEKTLLDSSNYSSYALPKSGGTLTGNLTIQKQTNATVSYTDTQNPRINFLNANGDQAVSLIFTDYDSYKAPYGLTLKGNGQSTANDGAYLKVEGNIQSSTMTATTFTGALSGNSTNVTQKKSLSSKSHSNYGTNNGYVPDMSFIAYWNGAYNSSNSSNLTYAHQGTIQCKPTNLYNNTSGSTGTITMSQTAANFSYIEIYYKNDNNRYGGPLKVYSPNGRVISIISTSMDSDGGAGGTKINFKVKDMTISGTTITRIYTGIYQPQGQVITGGDNVNTIAIYRIDGYK